MLAPPPVGIHDDLPPRHSRIATRAADHEQAAGVDVELGLRNSKSDLYYMNTRYI